MHNNPVDYANHIAIIGGGISGLTLGCVLKNAKIPVIIFEKSNDVSGYGAGISISPNGIRLYKTLIQLKMNLGMNKLIYQIKFTKKNY